MAPFSQRLGYVHSPKVKPESRNEEPLAMRNLVVDSAKRWGLSSVALRGIAWRVLKDDVGQVTTEAWINFRRSLWEVPWFSVYDIVEAIYADFDNDYRVPAPSAAAGFEEDVNGYLVNQGIPWQLVDGEITTRGDDTFEDTIKTAITVLENDAKPTAAERIAFARRALSARPKADNSGAVAHATSAIECVLGEITGKAMTLGAYFNKNPDLIHPALAKGFLRIYGYASDEGARHGKEGIEPTAAEAEFVVHSCAAICTLLTRKHPR
jgi:hypothetical protein